MHPYLQRLGIRPEVDSFFRPFYFSDAAGDLRFSYGDSTEHFGLAFHRVPATQRSWQTTCLRPRHLFISSSAMDAIIYLNKYYSYFANLDTLLFISVGNHSKQIKAPPDCQVTLLFHNDLLGRIADLKIACGLRKLPVHLAIKNDHVEVLFKYKRYLFEPALFSLNAFEKASGQRFGIRTHKPKNQVSWTTFNSNPP